MTKPGLLLLLAVLTTTSACGRIQPWVKPYERERLADRVMAWDRNPIASGYITTSARTARAPAAAPARPAAAAAATDVAVGNGSRGHDSYLYASSRCRRACSPASRPPARSPTCCPRSGPTSAGAPTTAAASRSRARRCWCARTSRDKVSVTAGYLVDQVSGASIDMIVLGASPLHEVRKQKQLGVDYLYGKTTYSAGIQSSIENDYDVEHRELRHLARACSVT